MLISVVVVAPQERPCLIWRHQDATEDQLLHLQRGLLPNGSAGERPALAYSHARSLKKFLSINAVLILYHLDVNLWACQLIHALGTTQRMMFQMNVAWKQGSETWNTTTTSPLKHSSIHLSKLWEARCWMYTDWHFQRDIGMTTDWQEKFSERSLATRSS